MSGKKATAAKRTGGKKKDRRSRSGKDSGSSNVEKLGEVQKELYLIQIQDLEEKLSRCSGKNVELENAATTLQEKLDEVVKDKADIVLYLKKIFHEKEKEAIDLQEELNEASKLHEEEKEQLNQVIESLKDEMQQSVQELQDENKELAVKLATLKEFEDQREALMTKLEELEKDLSDQNAKHEDEIHDVECQSAIYRDRLREQQLEEMRKMEEDLNVEALKRMNDTVKYAMEENKVLSAKVDTLARECTSLGDKNFNFETEWKQQREMISILKMSEKQLISKNISKMKVIDRLMQENEKLQTVADSQKILKFRCEESRLEADSWQRETKTAKTIIGALKSAEDQLKMRVESLLRDLKYEQDRRFQLENIHQNASAAIVEVILTDADDPAVEILRGNMLNHLLCLLNASKTEDKTDRMAELLNKSNIHDGDEGFLMFSEGILGMVPNEKELNLPTEVVSSTIKANSKLCHEIREDSHV